MTIDRAAEILDPEHREHYDGLEEVNEACRIGMEALKRQRWVPVSERLPEPGKPVLGWCKDNKISPFECWPVYYAPSGWIALYTGHYVNAITHWMPLPEPPKAENK